MDDDPESIAEPIRKALQCPMCLQLACRIRCCCYEGHMVCARCYSRLELNEVPACPMCRSPIEDSHSTRAFDMAVSKIIQIMKITCSYRSLGCRELVPIPDINEHESSCQYAPEVKCFVSTCQWAGICTQIYDHVIAFHPSSAVSVQGNTWTIPDVEALLIGRQRKSFLIKDERDNMMWLILSRGYRRSTVRVFMMKVKTSGQHSTMDSTGMTYNAIAGTSTVYPCYGRRKLMMWDKNMVENSDAAIESTHGLIVRQFKFVNALTVSWNIR